GHAKQTIDKHKLAARDQPTIHVDIDRLADTAVKLEDVSSSHSDEIAHLDAGAAENRLYFNGYLKDGFHFLSRRTNLSGREIILRRHFVKPVALFFKGQGDELLRIVIFGHR